MRYRNAFAYNKGMKAVFHLSISAVCVAMLVTLSVSALAKPADVSVWVTNPRLTSQLAPERSFGAFQWSPPSGYRWGCPIYGYLHLNDPILGSILRPDKTQTYLAIVSGDTPSTTSMAPDALMAFIQQLVQTGKQKFAVLPVQRGEVNRLPAIRERYQYVLPSGVIVHGFIYILKDKSGCFTADASDAEPYCKTTLPLLEASILTVREAQSSSATSDAASSTAKP